MTLPDVSEELKRIRSFLITALKTVDGMLDSYEDETDTDNEPFDEGELDSDLMHFDDMIWFIRGKQGEINDKLRQTNIKYNNSPVYTLHKRHEERLKKIEE
ncbi:hypothetical protein HK097_009210 [Rhizophlyctis rosea]|uniref:Uncharacterized protein n=1 Tax=Rhizophlyctis rosea TaxID=64517 RepID=A0AAD5S974_9FUNG|nr:hypothetical protein HK097_009210 [Rhizophlyctis rosea]